jgi:hypothetical protein
MVIQQIIAHLTLSMHYFSWFGAYCSLQGGNKLKNGIRLNMVVGQVKVGLNTNM